MALLGLGVFYGGVIVGVPVVTGVAEGIHHQKEQNKEAANETRMVKFWIDSVCESDSSKYKDEIEGMMVVLHKNGVWLWHKDEESGLPRPLAPDKPPPHPFEGFYIMYPDEDRSPPQRGLVSTVSRDPPLLNWIFADKDDYSFTYGNRSQSMPHLVGPWDWSEDEKFVTLEDWEGFAAVRVGDEESKAADGLRWKLYYDKNDDELNRGKMVGGKPVVPISFSRRILPDEFRRMQEEEADRKMQVKSTGDLKTKMDYR